MEKIEKSVYDVLLHNLKLSERKTCMHRYIYAGEHKGEKETEEAFSKLIKTTNEAYCEEKLTGVLVLYPNFFFHIIDGDEISFVYHLSHLFVENDNLFGEMRLLTVYHHINQRFFDKWAARKAKPPILLEKIDPASDFEELKRHLGICITKIYNLALHLRETDPDESEEYNTIGQIVPYMNQYLPEYTLLNYLVHQKQLYSMRDIAHFELLVLDTTYMLLFLLNHYIQHYLILNMFLNENWILNSILFKYTEFTTTYLILKYINSLCKRIIPIFI